MNAKRTVERTHRKIMLFAHTLIMRGSDVANLAEFRPVLLGGDSVKDKWTDDRRMDGRTHAWKTNVALAHTYYEEN